MGILEDILASVENTQGQVDRLEAEVRALLNLREPAPVPTPQPAQTIADTPAPLPAPAPGGSLYSGVPGGGAVPTPTPSATPGPQPVPTLEELNALLLDLQRRSGTDLCVSLMRQHQGESPDGSVSLTNIPAEQYAALQQAIRQQLGVH